MKKVLSLLLVLGALLFGLSFNGQGVYAFDPDVDAYEDLFYEIHEVEFTVETDNEDTTANVTSGTFELLLDLIEEFGIINEAEYIVLDINSIYLNDALVEETNQFISIYYDGFDVILTSSSGFYDLHINNNDILTTDGYTIQEADKISLVYLELVPWTQSYSYGRSRDYNDSLSYPVQLKHDIENGRVYLTPTPSTNNLWTDQWFDYERPFAFTSRYSNFKIVNGSGVTVKDVSNVAAVYFEPDNAGFDYGMFTIYYWSGEDILKTNYYWQDLNASYTQIEAYFYGGYRQAISGDLVFVANVEEEKPLSYFLDFITAYDDIDGDISDEVYVISDTYTGNEAVLGTYEVEVGVEDSENQESTLIFDIVVVDVTDPVVAATDTESISYVSTFNLTTYGTTLKGTATDNYYATEDLTVTVFTDGYTANKSLPGSYDVVYRVTDPSGNFAEHTLTITVTDPVAPEFTSGVATLSKDINEMISSAQIVATQVVTDAIDGNVSDSIEIISDTYTGNETTPGTYHIIIRAYDESGNMVERDITVNVFSGVPGWWIPDDGPIIIPNGSELTLEQIIAVLVSVNWIDEELAPTVTLLSSDYFGNEDKPGEYKLNLLIDGVATEFDLLVLNAGDNWFPDVQTPVVEASFNWLWWTLGIAVLGAFAVGTIYIFRKKK